MFGHRGGFPQWLSERVSSASGRQMNGSSFGLFDCFEVASICSAQRTVRAIQSNKTENSDWNNEGKYWD
jgi:carbohydrate-selective porin OprB